MYQSLADDMGSISLVDCHRRKLGLSLLFHWLTWEINLVWTHGSVSRRAVDYAGSPFFRAVGSIQICQRLVKCCHIRGLPIESICQTYVDWSGKDMCHVDRFPLQGVHRFESPRLSDMSTTCS
jgi:hypothetical protein